MLKKTKLPDDMDSECLKLCEALNLLPGILTTNSCCGHGERPYRIFFHAEDLDALPELCYWFDNCHSGESGWQVTVYTDCGMSPARFLIEGPIGAHDASKKIAKLINEFIESK